MRLDRFTQVIKESCIQDNNQVAGGNKLASSDIDISSESIDYWAIRGEPNYGQSICEEEDLPTFDDSYNSFQFVMADDSPSLVAQKNVNIITNTTEDLEPNRNQSRISGPAFESGESINTPAITISADLRTKIKRAVENPNVPESARHNLGEILKGNYNYLEITLKAYKQYLEP